MKTKKTYKFFTIFQHEKEQDYLRNMHRSGWKFVKLSCLCAYHFKRCDPEDVIYQLDYNQEGIAHKDEYVKMFNDCGWEYLQDYAGYSYFRKPASETAGDEEIFCDDNSRLQMLERVYNGRILPLVFMFSCVLLPQFIISIAFDTYILTLLSGTGICMYVTIFILFARQYRKINRK